MDSRRFLWAFALAGGAALLDPFAQEIVAATESADVLLQGRMPLVVLERVIDTDAAVA